MKEKGRGTLQTSALPLGYGAVRLKLASYLDFLNPPLERFQTSALQTSALRFRTRRTKRRNVTTHLEFPNPLPLEGPTVGNLVGTRDSLKPPLKAARREAGRGQLTTRVCRQRRLTLA